MYTKKRSQKFSDKYLLCLLGKLVGLILIFNASTCQCKPAGPDNTASITIETNNLLIGDKDEQRQIKAIFRLDNSGNRAEVENFRLKVSIVEQNTFTSKTTGSKITYKSAANGDQTFSDTDLFEKPLTEFSNLTMLDPDKEPKEISGEFILVPDDNAIEVKLKFELINTVGVSPTPVEVRWIKNEFAINLPTDFSGPTSYFSLKPLKEDIEDLSKYTVVLKSETEGVTFNFETKTGTPSKATLAELLKLGRTPRLVMNQETNAIPVKINGTATAKFTISVFTNDGADGATDSRLLGEMKGEWRQNDPDAGLGQEEGQLGNINNQQHSDEKALKKLKQDKKDLVERKKQVSQEFKFKKAELKKKRDEDLTNLKAKGKELKKGEYTKQKAKIHKDFEKAVKDIKENKFDKDLKDIQDQIDKNSKEQKVLKPKIAKNKQDAKKAKKHIDEEAKKSTKAPTTSPKLILTVPKGYLNSDKSVFVTVKNLGRDLKQKDLKAVTLWYEIKNSVGDTSKVILHGKKNSAKGERNMEKIQKITPGQKVSLAEFFNTFTAHSSKDIALRIATTDNSDITAESMQFVIHLEGMDNHVPPATATWTKYKLPKE